MVVAAEVVASVAVAAVVIGWRRMWRRAEGERVEVEMYGGGGDGDGGDGGGGGVVVVMVDAIITTAAATAGEEEAAAATAAEHEAPPLPAKHIACLQGGSLQHPLWC